MTQSAPLASPPSSATAASDTPPGQSQGFDFSPETFWAVLIRRTRYAAAILLSALLFCTVGWRFAAPLPQMEGISLLAWQNHGVAETLMLALLLLGATLISTLLVHPDSPHMGIFCALLGLAGLSIRGGTVHMLVQYAQRPDLYPGLPGIAYANLCELLATECIQWAFLFLVAEVFGRLLHDRFFANTTWITRSGPDLAHDTLEQTRPGGAAMGVSLAVSRTLGTHKMRRRVATPLAMIYSGALAILFLYVFMQSQAKGQVLMACFVAFFGSTLLAYLAFPRVPILALLLTVPLTAAVGYFYSRYVPGTGPHVYPGHAAFFVMRALPIDYVTAGIPGAILGYYGAFRWSLHSPEEG